MLSHGGEDMDHQLVGVWIVHCHKFHATPSWRRERAAITVISLTD
jgi:hypothetical protein